MFSIQRVYAFTVLPQRGVEDESWIDPVGGPVAITLPLKEVIQSAFEKAARGVRTTVDFELDATRTNVVREDVLTVAFGATKAPGAAGARLASRLSQTMDNRSHAALLVIVVEEEDPKRRVSLVVLPKEIVVQMRRGGEDVLIDVLRDAFSTGSHLRKLARFEGHNSRTQFLSAEILDFQLASAHRATAEFWIRTFLASRPRIDSEAGSRLLAAALQRAYEAAPVDDRDAVSAAMLKARAGTVKSTSLERFAVDELPESVVSPFFGTNNNEMRHAVFMVARPVMQEALGRYVITGADGVVISAPAEAMGRSVEVSSRGKTRSVSYNGTIQTERVARDRRRSHEPRKDGQGDQQRRAKQ